MDRNMRERERERERERKEVGEIVGERKCDGVLAQLDSWCIV